MRHEAFSSAASTLGACRTWSVESENRRFHQNRPQRGQFLPGLQPHGQAMGQKDGEKWTAAADLQPTISKSDRLLGRRRLVMAVPLLGGLAWARSGRAAALQAAPSAVQGVVLRDRRPLLGTAVDIVVQGQDAAALRQAMDQAYARMQVLQALFSRFEPHSAVRRIGDAAGVRAVPVPPVVMAVLQEAKRVSAATGGAFDATVGGLKAWHFGAGEQRMPDAREVARQLRYVNAGALVLDARAGTAFLQRPGMALDLGGIAKLPILEAGMQVLQAHGVENAMVNGGGDVLVQGQLQGRPWRVGLRDPRAPSQLLGAVALQGSALVASSGDYERCFMHAGQRQHHVLDPHTGWPTQGVHGVSLVARSVAEVNGLGTALMVLGPVAGRALAEQTPGLAVLMAQSDGSVWQSAAMQRRLVAV